MPQISYKFFDTSSVMSLGSAVVIVEIIPLSDTDAQANTFVVTRGHESQIIQFGIKVSGMGSDAEAVEFAVEASRHDARMRLQEKVVDPVISEKYGPSEFRRIDLVESNRTIVWSLRRPDAAAANLRTVASRLKDSDMRRIIDSALSLAITLEP